MFPVLTRWKQNTTNKTAGKTQPIRLAPPGCFTWNIVSPINTEAARVEHSRENTHFRVGLILSQSIGVYSCPFVVRRSP